MLDTILAGVSSAFIEKGKTLKEEMAKTYVPAINHIKRIHHDLEARADVSYGKGLALFNKACKELEAATLAEYEDIVKTYENARVKRS